MKFFFGFVCVALPLLSVVNSTARINTRLQAKYLEHPFKTFSELKQQVIRYTKFEAFLISIAKALLVATINNLELDDNFKDLMRQVKYVSVLFEIRSHPRKYERTPRIVIVNAKRKMGNILFAEIKRMLSRHHYTIEQINFEFEKYFVHFNWDETIRNCTQSHTAEMLELHIKVIYRNLENNSVDILSKFLIECESKCISALELHYLNGITNYEPLEKEFVDFHDIVSYFMEFFNIIEQNQQENLYFSNILTSQPGAALYASYGVALTGRNPDRIKFLADERVIVFYDQLRRTIDTFVEHKYLELKEMFSSCSDFNYFIKNILCKPKEWISSISEALFEESLAMYSESTVKYVSSQIRELLEKSFDFDFFHSSVCVTELLLSFLIRGQMENLREFTFTTLEDFSRLITTSEHCTTCDQLIPRNRLSEETALSLINAMIHSSKLYLIFRFNYKLGVELERSMKEKRATEASPDKKCTECLTGSSENDPFVIPICSCQKKSFHASCYAMKMANENYVCSGCGNIVYSLQFDKYIDNYDISIAERVAPVLRKLMESIPQYEENPSNLTVTDESQSSIGIKRDSEPWDLEINGLYEYSDMHLKAIKKYLLELVASRLRGENETLEQLVKRHKENIPELHEILKNTYESVLERMKEFVKKHASQNSEFKDVWPKFESNWWESLKKLTEWDFERFK